MTTTTEPPIALLASERTERRLRPLVHPRLATVLVPGIVVLTAGLLYTWWPAGVLVGSAACTVAVLAVGLVMQRAERKVPVAEDLVVALGIRGHAPVAAPRPVPARRAGFVAIAEAQVVASRDDLRAAQEVEAAAVARHAAEEAALAPVFDRVAEQQQVGDADVARLRRDLGADFDDFTRAAKLVVATQYASAARLQRELGVTYSRARRLMDGLENEHFVGPATGTLPRQVMVRGDQLPELERILVGTPA